MSGIEPESAGLQSRPSTCVVNVSPMTGLMDLAMTYSPVNLV